MAACQALTSSFCAKIVLELVTPNAAAKNSNAMKLFVTIVRMKRCVNDLACMGDFCLEKFLSLHEL
jgi:hypothetical protein